LKDKNIKTLFNTLIKKHGNISKPQLDHMKGASTLMKEGIFATNILFSENWDRLLPHHGELKTLNAISLNTNSRKKLIAAFRNDNFTALDTLGKIDVLRELAKDNDTLLEAINGSNEDTLIELIKNKVQIVNGYFPLLNFSNNSPISPHYPISYDAFKATISHFSISINKENISKFYSSLKIKSSDKMRKIYDSFGAIELICAANPESMKDAATWRKLLNNSAILSSLNLLRSNSDTWGRLKAFIGKFESDGIGHIEVLMKMAANFDELETQLNAGDDGQLLTTLGGHDVSVEIKRNSFVRFVKENILKHKSSNLFEKLGSFFKNKDKNYIDLFNNLTNSEKPLEKLYKYPLVFRFLFATPKDLFSKNVNLLNMEILQDWEKTLELDENSLKLVNNIIASNDLNNAYNAFLNLNESSQPLTDPTDFINWLANNPNWKQNTEKS